MKKHILLLAISALLFASCGKEETLLYELGEVTLEGILTEAPMRCYQTPCIPGLESAFLSNGTIYYLSNFNFYSLEEYDEETQTVIVNYYVEDRKIEDNEVLVLTGLLFKDKDHKGDIVNSLDVISYTIKTKGADSSREVKALVLSAEEQELQYQTNAFSMNMLSLIGTNEKDKENICFSPLSASMALGIMMNGADGNTLTQLQTTLGFEGATQDGINAYYHKLIDVLPQLDATTIVTIANALWLRSDFPINETYKQTTKEVFEATIDNVDDFTRQATLDLINQWAADNTNNLITKVITREMVNDQTIMIFANALYFKGVWENEFDKKFTQKEKFTTKSGKQVDAYMMRKFDTGMLYAENETMQMVELNYKDGKYCIDLLLPKQTDGIYDLIASLTIEQWENYLSLRHWAEVNLSVPRFKFTYDRSLEKDLQTLGITDIFTLQANLSRLSGIPTLLSFIKQYCYIAVDEEGTEAAAVTIGGVTLTSAGPDETKTFHADHPFLFVIREKEYGTILFSGILGNPQEN